MVTMFNVLLVGLLLAVAQAVKAVPSILVYTKTAGTCRFLCHSVSTPSHSRPLPSLPLPRSPRLQTRAHSLRHLHPNLFGPRFSVRPRFSYRPLCESGTMDHDADGG